MSRRYIGAETLALHFAFFLDSSAAGDRAYTAFSVTMYNPSDSDAGSTVNFCRRLRHPRPICQLFSVFPVKKSSLAPSCSLRELGSYLSQSKQTIVTDSAIAQCGARGRRQRKFFLFIHVTRVAPLLFCFDDLLLNSLL